MSPTSLRSKRLLALITVALGAAAACSTSTTASPGGTSSGTSTGATAPASATSSGSAAASGSPTAIKAGPGVDVASKTITIGNVDALSGPAAPLGQPLDTAARVFWDAVNDQGGIDGWKVKLVSKDDQYSTTAHVQAYDAIHNQVAVLMSFGSPTTLAIQQKVDAEKLVTVPGSFDSLWGADPVIAPVGTPYAFDVANALGYLTHEGAQKPKIGIIYQNDAYGQDGVRGFKAAMSAYGFKDAGEEPFAAGDTNFVAQVQALKTAGADIVVITAIPSASGPIIGTAASLNFHPTLVLQGPAYIEQLVTSDGSLHGKPSLIQGAVKGAYVTMFAAAWGDTNVPGMAGMLAAQAKYAPSQQPTIYFTYGYAQQLVIEAILKKAIESGDLTRQGIYNAKLNLGHVDLQGLAPDVTYTPSAQPPSRASNIEVVDPTVPGFLKPLDMGYESGPAKTLTISSGQ